MVHGISLCVFTKFELDWQHETTRLHVEVERCLEVVLVLAAQIYMDAFPHKAVQYLLVCVCIDGIYDKLFYLADGGFVVQRLAEVISCVSVPAEAIEYFPAFTAYLQYAVPAF